MTNALSSIRFSPSFGSAAQFSSAKKESPDSDTSPYGHQAVGVQNYLPVTKKRDLGPDEKADVQSNLNNWLPTLFPGYGTKASELLASPVKIGALSGTFTGGLLGSIAGGLHALATHGDATGITAAIGASVAAVSGIFAGVMSYFHRDQENNNLVDLIKRLPPGATKRDLLSDPVYQQDQQLARIQAASGNRGSFTDTALTAGILSTLLNNRRN